MKLTQLIAAFMLLYLSSCTSIPDDVKASLSYAGSNSAELMRVITHYQSADRDAEKLKAAYFLISNMRWHYSYDPQLSIPYYAEIDSVLNLATYPEHDVIEAISQKHLQKKKLIVSDVKIAKADFLIRNIDNAFQLWRTKFWCNQLSFEDFCESILPYKCVELQPLDNWKDTLNLKYMTYYDDTIQTYTGQYQRSPYHVALELNKDIASQMRTKYNVDYSDYPFLSASSIYRIPFGDCEAMSLLPVAAMRSKGVAAFLEYIPNWGEADGGHVFYSVATKPGFYLPLVWGIDSTPGDNSIHTTVYPKIYRGTYSVNKRVLEYQQSVGNMVDFNSYLFQKDITDCYVPTSDVNIDIASSYKGYAYIAVFDHCNWKMVEFAKIEHGKAYFKNMGRGVVYLIVCVNKASELEPASPPFILENNGRLNYLVPDKMKKSKVRLKRKYLKFDWVLSMEDRMIGGEVHASNNPAFSSFEVIYKIKDHDYPDLIKNDRGRFRYWRFAAAPKKSCALAEFQLFDQANAKLGGKLIGTLEPYDSSLVARNAFDGDWLTSFNYKENDGGWIGLDLGKPVYVNQIRLVARSDDNGIHCGDEYELYYWDNNWHSLGRKIAFGRIIEFTDVPENALLILRNHTRGNEERIFTYENGAQCFR